MHMLVVDLGTSLGDPAGHQAIPFGMYAGELSDELGLTVEQVTAATLEEIEVAVRQRPADVAVILISWKNDVDVAIEFFKNLEAIPGRPRLVYVDYLAPSGSPFFGVMPHVDCYVKRQHLADLSQYSRDFQGGYVFTDFLAQEMGFDLKGWCYGTKPDPAQLAEKLVTGWNLGVTPRYRAQLRVTRRLRSLWRTRPIAIHQRFSPISMDKDREWYEEYRHQAALKLAPLGGKYRMTGTNRINHRLYLAELISSKLVVSPFGWGEVCFRDYEVVATGALLIKPSMDHLVTHPDIYEAGETYVSVRWDLEDLADTCEYYLNHPEESMRIIRNAQDALFHYYEKGGFVEDVRSFLEVAMRDREEPSGEAVAHPCGLHA